MRTQLAGTLVLVAALAGLPLGRTPAAGLPQSRTSDALAAALDSAPASQVYDTGGGSLIRKGPLIDQLYAPAVTVPVPGYADIFLAGRKAPFTISGRFGVDVAVRNGPACVRIQEPAGGRVSVTTRFGTANGFSSKAAKDANGFTARSILAGPSERPQPASLGLSSIRAPENGLVGVFIGARVRATTPPTLDFSTARARDMRELHPRLYQVFYIGTGATSTGRNKHYIIPTGATSLCLGSLDHAGGNHDNHGVILAFVSGIRPSLFAPLPRATATARRSIASATATPAPGTFYPTATNTNTPSVTATAITPSGFKRNSSGQLINALGTPVSLNAQGTPVNSQGAPVNSQGQVVNAQGAPVATQGTGGGSSGGGGSQPPPPPAGGGGGGSGGVSAATSTPVPTVTNVPTTTRTGTPTTSPTPSVTATSTPIFQPVGETWAQFQFDYQHNGFQSQDSGSANVNNPNADPNSPLYAGKLRLQTVSTAINGNVSVAGGPILGLSGLYYTSGADGALRCVWANGTDTTGYVCPGGFGKVSFGPNFEDNVPVIDPAQNVIYYLSHNNPLGVLANQGGVTGSLTAYNASTGARLNYQGRIPLVTAPGVALTVYNNTCYVPTNDPDRTGGDPDNARRVLHFLNCGPNGDGADRLYIPAIGTSPTPTAPPTPLIGQPTPVAPPPLPPPAVSAPAASRLEGIPLAGVAIDPTTNTVLVAEQDPGGTSGTLEAFFDADNSLATTGHNPGDLAWTAPLPGAGAGYVPFQPIIANRTVIVATNYGIAAYDLGVPAAPAVKTPIWKRTGVAAPPGDRVPAATLTFSATSVPAFDPITGTVYAGFAAVQSGIFYLAALNYGTGAVTALGPADTAIIDGAPVVDHGLTTSAGFGNADVVFYADGAGGVTPLRATTLAPLLATNGGSFPDRARSSIAGPGGAPIGASLIVANGHLYFGDNQGRIFNYSF